MAKKAIIILADGFEEIEAITPIDVLRRAGIDVLSAGLGTCQVRGAHDILIDCDTTLKKSMTSEYDALILPGGSGGAENLSRSGDVQTLTLETFRKGGFIAALCATPAIFLAKTDILNGRRATCYPGMQAAFGPDVTFVEEDVVVDGQVITSRGPGTALPFSLVLVEKMVGGAIAAELSDAMLAGGVSA